MDLKIFKLLKLSKLISIVQIFHREKFHKIVKIDLKDVADFERIWAKNAFFAQDWLHFNIIYLFGFLSLNSDQVMKKHLLDRDNRLARTIWTRARLRAWKPRLCPP